MVDMSDNIDDWVIDLLKWFLISVFDSFNSAGGSVVSGLRYGLVIFGENAQVRFFATKIDVDRINREFYEKFF